MQSFFSLFSLCLGCVCSCVNMEAREGFQQFSSGAPYLTFWNRVSHWIWNSWVQLDWVACELWQFSCLPALFPPSQHWGQTCGQSCAWLFTGLLGSKFKSCCWCSKLFSHWFLFLVATYTLNQSFSLLKFVTKKLVIVTNLQYEVITHTHTHTK